MEYTEQKFENIFLKETKHTNTIPAYLREYSRFYRLMKIFANYIQNAVDIISNIQSKLNLQEAHGDILEKIAQRLDIYIEKPVDENGNVDYELYQQQLKIAILGNGIKRTSRADRNTLSSVTEIFSSIRRCEITDYSVSKESEIPMFAYISVVGSSEVWTKEMLEKYVFPNITGVGIVVSYLIDNNTYFGFDTENSIKIIGSIDVDTALITQELLTQKASELGYSGSKLILGISIRDASDNIWTFMKTEWKNNGIITEGETVIDPEKGYAIRGWDEGQWIEENPID